MKIITDKFDFRTVFPKAVAMTLLVVAVFVNVTVYSMLADYVLKNL